MKVSRKASSMKLLYLLPGDWNHLIQLPGGTTQNYFCPRRKIPINLKWFNVVFSVPSIKARTILPAGLQNMHVPFLHGFKTCACVCVCEHYVHRTEKTLNYRFRFWSAGSCHRPLGFNYWKTWSHIFMIISPNWIDKSGNFLIKKHNYERLKKFQ